MTVPFIDLLRQISGLRPEIDAALGRVLDSGRFILGPEVEAFEAEASAFAGTSHAVGVASGTDALVLALRACGIRPGDRVATTPFSFFATASAIVCAGGRPVFVDVEADTLNMDPAALRALLDSARGASVRAVLPVHLFGLMADMRGILEAARRRGLPVVEDAAQAFGASRDGAAAGAAGAAAGVSFFPTKNLGGIGDGGLVLTGDAAVARSIRTLRNHGSDRKNAHSGLGWNSRLDAVQAAVLRAKLGRLPEWNRGRRGHAAFYRTAFSDLDLLRIPAEPAGATHIYHHYTVRVGEGRRDTLQAFLAARGIGTEVYYPTPIHLQPALKEFGFVRGSCPEAERAATEVLSLPVFPELTEAEREEVAGGVRAFAGAPAGRGV